ncbi:MAG TPA: hypothetical protein VHB51_02030 [Candidatus Saccharimonadales bacterium]|nr:hypothetical protein [Candidatus Saccharimonadales bacterium]
MAYNRNYHRPSSYYSQQYGPEKARSNMAMWFGIGVVVATLATDIAHSRDQQKAQEQVISQLQTDLGDDYQPVTDLTVNMDKETFQFQTHIDGQAERCTGDYLVREAMAAVSGKLTCKPVVVTNQ